MDHVELSDAERPWLERSFRKVRVKVGSEEELIAICEKSLVARWEAAHVPAGGIVLTVLAGGARSPRPVSMNHVMIPVTTAGAAGWPSITRRAVADRTAAAIAHDKPLRPPAGDAGREQPGGADLPRA